MGLRFAIDTGGTFTDLMVSDEAGLLTMHKASTTPSDPIAGRDRKPSTWLRLPQARTSATYLGRGEMLVHGTTHAINAIVTGSTARTAFLTTAGHPDTLVFREGGRMEPFNFTIPYTEPYVPKALTFEIQERVTADGKIRIPLDEESVVATLDELRSKKIEAIAVCLLWSIVNPAHELALGRLIERHLKKVPYTLSHRINPSIREISPGVVELHRCVAQAVDGSLHAWAGGSVARCRVRRTRAGRDLAGRRDGCRESRRGSGSPHQLRSQYGAGRGQGPTGRETGPRR